MATMLVKNAAGADETIEKPLAPGRAAAAASRPVVLSEEDKSALDALVTLLEEQRPGGAFADVTPSDSSDLPGGPCRAIMVVADGDLEFRGAEEESGSHTIPVVAGQMWPIRVRRVLDGTTATVLAVY